MLVLAPAKNQTSQPYSVFFTQAILTMILVLNVVLYIVEGVHWLRLKMHKAPRKEFA